MRPPTAIRSQNDSRKWINDLCGYWWPHHHSYASHHRNATHHRYTNQPDKDPDFVVSGMQKNPLAMIIAGLDFGGFRIPSLYSTAGAAPR